MMTNLVLILFLVAALKVGEGHDDVEFPNLFQYAQCQWKNIDPEKDVPLEVVEFAADTLIADFESADAVRLVKIMSAQSMNMKGKVYDLELLFEVTDCPSSSCYDDIYNSTVCAAKNMHRRYVKIFHQPWTYTLVADNHNGISGGWNRMDPADVPQDVITALEQQMTDHFNNTDHAMRLAQITKASQHVVAGTNYELSVVFHVKQCPWSTSHEDIKDEAICPMTRSIQCDVMINKDRQMNFEITFHC